jgi:hypothetical protein
MIQQKTSLVLLTREEIRMIEDMIEVELRITYMGSHNMDLDEIVFEPVERFSSVIGRAGLLQDIGIKMLRAEKEAK